MVVGQPNTSLRQSKILMIFARFGAQHILRVKLFYGWFSRRAYIYSMLLHHFKGNALFMQSKNS